MGERRSLTELLPLSVCQPSAAVYTLLILLIHQIKRIKTEEKAKVVASVWGKEFNQFLAEFVVLPRMIFNNRMNCTRMI